MSNQLISFIDAQNTEQLNQYLIQNPDIDLNNVTPNGASALWVAITPPQNKNISLSVIQLLISTGRIDPTQQQYNEPITKRGIPEKIRKEISQYEEQYIHPQILATPLQGTLQRLALNRQNTHDALIVKTYDSYVEKLYRRYVINYQKELFWNDDILLYIDSQSSYRLNRTLSDSIKRIKKDTEARHINSLDISLTNAELLMLLWHANCDLSPESFVDGIDMSHSEQIIRKNHLLDSLIDTHNTYGLNHHTCFMGTRHKIIESLDAVHRDCVPSEESLLLPEHIAEMYATHCHEALYSLENNKPALWTEYIHYIWRDISNPDLQEWISQVHDLFLIKIKQTQQSRALHFQMHEKTFNQQLELYGSPDTPLNHRLHPKARLSDQLSTIQIFLKNPVENLTRWVNNGLKSITIDQLNWNQLLENQMAINDLCSESVLWLILESLLQNTQWAAWIKSLPVEVKTSFFKTIIMKHSEQDSVIKHLNHHRFSLQIMQQVALDLVISSGYWDQFPIEDMLLFENKDLRGFDLSHVDLSKMTFNNCDLRLTGILSNPTLTQEHLAANNQIENDAIFIAARANFLIALDILIERRKIKIDRGPIGTYDQHMLPLYSAAVHGRIEAVRLILSKTQSDEFKNFQHGIEAIINARSETIAIEIFEAYATTPDFFKYRFKGKTIFTLAITNNFHELAERILNKHSAVASDINDDGRSALELSLNFNSFHLTHRIFSYIPQEKMLSILKNDGTSRVQLKRLLTIIALKGNQYLPLISSILKMFPHKDILKMRDNDGQTILMELAKVSPYENFDKIVDKILENDPGEEFINIGQQTYKWDVPQTHENTAIITAIYNNNPLFIKSILQKYPTISVLNAKNKLGYTALMAAASKRNHQVIDVILECLECSPELSEKVINAQSTDQSETALMIAAKKYDLNIVEMILKHKTIKNLETVINYKKNDGDTVLHIAIKIGDRDMVNTILKLNSSDAVLNAQNHHGETALSLAIRRGYLNIVETILKFNSSEAVLNFKGKDGIKPVLAAIAPFAISSRFKTLIIETMRTPCYFLERQIKQLKQYGEQLVISAQSNEEVSAGEAAVDLSKNLTRSIIKYYSSPEHTRQTQKDEFKDLLSAGYHSMGEHMRTGCMHQSLICITSCLFTPPISESKTPIGGVTSGYFFQTTRQKEVSKISALFEALNPSETPSQNNYHRLSQI